MERTDTALITWLEANRHDVDYHGDVRKPWAVWESPLDGKMLGEGDTWREAVNAAMSAAEAQQLEAAKAMFWERDWELWVNNGIWHCGSRSCPWWSMASRDHALLNAYRASKGK